MEKRIPDVEASTRVLPGGEQGGFGEAFGHLQRLNVSLTFLLSTLLEVSAIFTHYLTLTKVYSWFRVQYGLIFMK